MDRCTCGDIEDPAIRTTIIDPRDYFKEVRNLYGISYYFLNLTIGGCQVIGSPLIARDSLITSIHSGVTLISK